MTLREWMDVMYRLDGYGLVITDYDLLEERLMDEYVEEADNE